MGGSCACEYAIEKAARIDDRLIDGEATLVIGDKARAWRIANAAKSRTANSLPISRAQNEKRRTLELWPASS